MIIDVQTHFIPKAYLEMLRPHQGLTAIRATQGAYHVEYTSGLSFTVDETLLDPSGWLKEMDAAGVDLAVLSLHLPGPEQFSAEVGVPAARLANDCLAETIAAHPSRFSGIATLPVQDPAAALDELERCVSELGLKGVQWFSNAAGKPIDSPELMPVYQRMAELGVPLFLHPTYPVMAEVMKEYYLTSTVGMLFDTSLAALRLILGGVMERLPDLKVMLPHMGSTLPYLIGRIDHLIGARGRRLDHLTRPPSEFLKRFYVDTVNPSAPALRFGLEHFGAGRVMLGSDYPWHGFQEYVTLIRELKLPPEDQEKILCRNAAALLGLG
jgi:predicted TIM-barrel fold metal-dependent hydrolase